MIPQLLLSFLLSFAPLSSSQSSSASQLYLNCRPRPFTCGSIAFNISYPFEIDGRPLSCGHPGYALRCIKNSTLATTISSRDYQILAIDYPSLHLDVVDSSFLGNSCPLPAANTTVDSSLYQFTDLDKAVTLLKNCSEIPLGFRNLSCSAGNDSYYVIGDGGSIDVGENCESAVEVVMHQTVVDLVTKGEVELGYALQQGFTLRWTAGDGWCDGCLASGGLCGYNSTNTCICASGSCSSAGKHSISRKVVIGDEGDSGDMRVTERREHKRGFGSL